MFPTLQWSSGDGWCAHAIAEPPSDLEVDGADRLPADPVARNEAYAHFGHKDFILCLGYRTDVVKNYFLNYNESVSNDFTL